MGSVTVEAICISRISALCGSSRKRPSFMLFFADILLEIEIQNLDLPSLLLNNLLLDFAEIKFSELDFETMPFTIVIP